MTPAGPGGPPTLAEHLRAPAGRERAARARPRHGPRGARGSREPRWRARSPGRRSPVAWERRATSTSTATACIGSTSWTNDLLLKALETTGVVSVAASEELAAPVVWTPHAAEERRSRCASTRSTAPSTPTWPGWWGRSSASVRDPGLASPSRHERCWAPGTRQIAAGYVLYGPATVFVYAAGGRVHAFVLDPVDGRFRLTQADARMPPAGRTYAVNDANWAAWRPRDPSARREAARWPADGTSLRPPVFRALWSRTSTGRSSRAASTSIPRTRAAPRAASGSCTRQRHSRSWRRRRAAARAPAARGSSTLVATDYHQRTPIFIGSAEEVGWVERAYRDGAGMSEAGPRCAGSRPRGEVAGGLAGRPEPLLPHRQRRATRSTPPAGPCSRSSGSARINGWCRSGRTWRRWTVGWWAISPAARIRRPSGAHGGSGSRSRCSSRSRAGGTRGTRMPGGRCGWPCGSIAAWNRASPRRSPRGSRAPTLPTCT